MDGCQSPNQSKYIYRSIGLALLCGLLAILMGMGRRADLIPHSLRWLAAILPVIPMVWYFLGLGAWLRSLDELQRLIQLEALLIQFGVTGIAILAYGLLAKFEVVPDSKISDVWSVLWMVIFFSWAIGQLIVRRKYR
jgi:hypothetical protein